MYITGNKHARNQHVKKTQCSQLIIHLWHLTASDLRDKSRHIPISG